MPNTGTMVRCKGCQQQFAAGLQLTQQDFANSSELSSNNTYNCPNCRGRYTYGKSDHFYSRAGQQASII